MSDFKAKMHQFDFGAGGSAPDPAGRACSARFPRPLAGFEGPTSK